MAKSSPFDEGALKKSEDHRRNIIGVYFRPKARTGIRLAPAGPAAEAGGYKARVEQRNGDSTPLNFGSYALSNAIKAKRRRTGDT